MVENFETMKPLIILLLAAMVCGCAPDIDTSLGTISNSGRFKVQRVAVFKDELSYYQRRGIYLIIDSRSGKEYLGISGIGISETGRHQVGKTQMTDER